jgi:hypothetical protein
MRLAQPVPRAEAVAAATAAPGLVTQMRALLPMVKDLSLLRARTVAGMPVLSAATRPYTGDREPLPEGLEGLPWDTGVRVSPVTGGALYAGERRNYRCATITVNGISSVEGFGLAEMMRDDVTRHDSYESAVNIRLNLPGHTGLYLLSFRLATDGEGAVALERARVSAAFTESISSLQRLETTCSPESDAIVALVQIPPDHRPLQARAELPLEAVTLRVQLIWQHAETPSYFGGLTVIRL